MGRRHPQRDIAKILFVDAGMTLDEIHAETGVSLTSLGNWKRDDKWDEEREVKSITPVSLIKSLYEQVNGILDDAKKDKRRLNAKESDSVVKLSKAINTLSNRIDPSTVMQVFAKQNNYIVAIDPDLAKKLLPHQKAILQEMLKVK